MENFKINPKNVGFIEICKAAELFGFKYRGGRGSHIVYVREEIEEILVFQNVKGKVKPYQGMCLLNIETILSYFICSVEN